MPADDALWSLLIKIIGPGAVALVSFYAGLMWSHKFIVKEKDATITRLQGKIDEVVDAYKNTLNKMGKD